MFKVRKLELSGRHVCMCEGVGVCVSVCVGWVRRSRGVTEMCRILANVGIIFFKLIFNVFFWGGGCLNVNEVVLS